MKTGIKFTAAKPEKRVWFDCRPRFWALWHAGFAVQAIALHRNPLPMFLCGMNCGIAFMWILYERFRRKMDQRYMEDMHDIRTANDIIAKMSYDTLHQMEKGQLN